MRPTWALLGAAAPLALCSGCFASNAECGQAKEPLEPNVTMTTPTELGDLEGLQTVCMGRADDGAPILSAQLRFHRPDSFHQLTVFAPLPDRDACGLAGAEHDVTATVRASPATAGHPPFMEANGRLRIDEAFPVSSGDGLSTKGELYLDGTGNPSLEDPDDLGFRYSAGPCE